MISGVYMAGVYRAGVYRARVYRARVYRQDLQPQEVEQVDVSRAGHPTAGVEILMMVTIVACRWTSGVGSCAREEGEATRSFL